MSIEGKVVIVTGGTSGIGEGCVKHFAQIGAKVVAASIQQAEGDALAAELDNVDFIYTDVSDEAQIKALIDGTLALHGRIDACASNAGAWRQGKVTDFNEADWDLIMGVNVKGNLYLAKYLAPVFEEQGKGVFVITTSVAAFIGFPEHALYCMSKAALDALVRCLTTDHPGYMRTVAICPGTIDTPMLAATAAGWTAPLEELYAEIALKIPVRRLGTPEDVAKAAAFLMSDDAGYVAGTSLFLEGGTMGLPPW